MAEPDRPPTTATATTATSNTHTEAEQFATEVLELHEIPLPREDQNVNYSYNAEYAPGTSSASLSSGETRIVPMRTVNRDRDENTNRNRTMVESTHKKKDSGAWARVRHFWCGQVALVVPQKSNRDHFALERTFLAYIRTSIALSMQGVLIAQLFRLQRFPSQEQSSLSYFEVAVPLSVACHGIALVIALIGAFRFWRQQTAIVGGSVRAGGWELNSTGLMISLVVVSMFVLSVVITVQLHGIR